MKGLSVSIDTCVLTLKRLFSPQYLVKLFTHREVEKNAAVDTYTLTS